MFKIKKVKLKRNRLSVITEDNLKDVKELYCIKDFEGHNHKTGGQEILFKKGERYSVRRRCYNKRTREGISFLVWPCDNAFFWKTWYVGYPETNDTFVASIINRRKPKDDTNKSETK